MVIFEELERSYHNSPRHCLGMGCLSLCFSRKSTFVFQKRSPDLKCFSRSSTNSHLPESFCLVSIRKMINFVWINRRCFLFFLTSRNPLRSHIPEKKCSDFWFGIRGIRMRAGRFFYGFVGRDPAVWLLWNEKKRTILCWKFPNVSMRIGKIDLNLVWFHYEWLTYASLMGALGPVDGSEIRRNSWDINEHAGLRSTIHASWCLLDIFVQQYLFQEKKHHWLVSKHLHCWHAIRCRYTKNMFRNPRKVQQSY